MHIAFHLYAPLIGRPGGIKMCLRKGLSGMAK
jgi:hypothetical protein